MLELARVASRPSLLCPRDVDLLVVKVVVVVSDVLWLRPILVCFWVVEVAWSLGRVGVATRREEA